MTIEKIRKTCKPPLGNRKDIAKFLPMRHSQMSELTSQSIISVGIDIRQPHSNWGEKTTNTHLYFYIIEGKLQYDSKGIYAEAGQLITIPSRLDKFFTAGEQTLKFVWVHFSNQFTGLTSNQEVKVLNTPHTQLVFSTVESLLLESVAVNQEINLTIPHLIRLFCHYVIDKPKLSSQRSSNEHKLYQLWDKVSNSLEVIWTVPLLSKELHMSESNFHRLILKLQNKSPMQIVKEMRMERAGSLLRTTQNGLDHIAKQVGYNNAYAFSDTFLKYAGIRPGKFRKKFR